MKWGVSVLRNWFRDIPERIYPVGRLDRDSEGMLLMTNDGDFANAMMHPSMHIPKTYRVTVRPSITEDQITEMTVGMMIDGKRRRCASECHFAGAGRVVLEIILYEAETAKFATCANNWD